MSFRRDGRAHEFDKWVRAHQAYLLSSGLPLVAWDSLEHWSHFLDHACLPREIDASEFSVEQLSDNDAVRFVAFVASSLAPGEPDPYVLRVLRDRGADHPGRR